MKALRASEGGKKLRPPKYLRGWFWPTLALITAFFAILLLPEPAEPATSPHPNISFFSRGDHLYVKNSGGGAGTVLVARKVRIFYPDGSRTVHRLPRRSVFLAPGSEQRLRFPRRPPGAIRICKSAGEVGVGSEALVCRPRYRRR